MLTLFFAGNQRLDEVPAGSPLTDNRQYSEYFARLLARQKGEPHCHIHEIRVDYSGVEYTGREPLGDATTYRLKQASQVASVTSIEC